MGSPNHGDDPVYAGGTGGVAVAGKRADEAPTYREPVARRWYANPYGHAVALYLLVRLCGLGMLALFAGHHDRALVDLLHAWDGEWYLAIAEQGYAGVPESLVDAAGNHTSVTPLAFFPGYPKLVAGLAGVTGMDEIAAGLLVSLLAGIAGACAVFRIGRMVDGRPRVGLLFVALWAGAPMAITLSMVYTEALFTALAAWALVGVLERNWWLAGLCCAAAGLVRPTASVLVAVVGLAAVVALFQAGRRWAAFACAVVCPLGLLGYWGYVAGRTGSLTGWFDIEEEGWATKFDFGVEAVEFSREVLAAGPSVMETGTVLILLAAVVLAVLLGLNRLPWPLVAYGVGIVIMVAGTAGLPFVKARFLLPGFVLLLPIALGLANRRTGTAVASTGALVLLGCWFSAYALTGWEYAI